MAFGTPSYFPSTAGGGGVAIQGSGTAVMSSGTAVFSNSNGVTFGLNGSTLTASAGVSTAQMSFWVNFPPGGNVVNLSTLSRPLFFPLNELAPMQGAMTWNTLGIACSGASNITTADAHTYSLYLGVYKLNNATQLTLLNSVSWTTGISASASSWQDLYAGTRFITIGSAAWSSTPAVAANSSYWGGMIISSSGTLATHIGILGANAFPSAASISGVVGATITTRPAFPFQGPYTTTTNALPTAVSLGEVGNNTASGGNGLQPNIWAAQGISWL